MAKIFKFILVLLWLIIVFIFSFFATRASPLYQGRHPEPKEGDRKVKDRQNMKKWLGK